MVRNTHGLSSNNTGKVNSTEVGSMMIRTAQKTQKKNCFSWLGLLLDLFIVRIKVTNMWHLTKRTSRNKE